MAEQPPKKKSKKSNKTKRTVLVVIISVLATAILILLFNLLLGGKTTVTGEKTANKKSTSLVCVSSSAEHPKITKTENSSKKELKLTLTFYDDELSSLGEIYTINYPNSGGVTGGESMIHAELNTNIADSGLKADIISTKYNQYDDALIVNLYMKGENLNDKTAPYFLINTNNTNGGQLTNWTIEDYARNYKAQGFSCEQKS